MGWKRNDRQRIPPTDPPDSPLTCGSSAPRQSDCLRAMVVRFTIWYSPLIAARGCRCSCGNLFLSIRHFQPPIFRIRPLTMNSPALTTTKYAPASSAGTSKPSLCRPAGIDLCITVRRFRPRMSYTITDTSDD